MKTASTVLSVRGARQHNLKNIDLDIPRNTLAVITGLSGSGKSSLAFDTLYAEGQRRYVESLSAYARQFLSRIERPDVERIEGLSPAVAIQQRRAGSNPRSTVGTITEVYDYLRVLFARLGKAHCLKCGRPVEAQTPQAIVDKLLELPSGSRLSLLAPVIQGRKGEHREVFESLRREGFVRARVDGTVVELEEIGGLSKTRRHSIEVVVDRLEAKPSSRGRLTESVEMALKVGDGNIIAAAPSGDILFSERNACARCGVSYGRPDPRIFSFNSPYGACPVCHGLGAVKKVDPDLVVPDPKKSVREGAIVAWKRMGMGNGTIYQGMVRVVAKHLAIPFDRPFGKLPRKARDALLYGTKERIRFRLQGKTKHYRHEWTGSFEGVISNLERRYHQTRSEFMRQEIGKYMREMECRACSGTRLKKESLAFLFRGMTITEITSLPVERVLDFFEGLELTPLEAKIGEELFREIVSRLSFLRDMGLGYLTIDRRSSTLAGGEFQRIRLATQIGSGLMGVLYILDEPSIGLHPRDNDNLLRSLERLRDVGNTVLVVEHDEATIRSADFVVDLGPGAGLHGGEVVYAGNFDGLIKCRKSLTGAYLRGDLKIEVPHGRRYPEKGKSIRLEGVSEHNLKGVDVDFPLGLFICVTGVSGSGKSTLVDETLKRALRRRLYRSRAKPGAHGALRGVENIDKVVVIDQSPIGRSPRSNPATYTGLFDPIRKLFAGQFESKVRGYRPGRFSFNVKGGRCEACRGEGHNRIEMHFLPDVYVTCGACGGKRYNRETLEIRYRGKSIAEVLAATVEEATELFDKIHHIRDGLRLLRDVGLGYIKLGQPATTLSGGEAQRVKLASELSRRSTGKTLYILDEPTTGLHFADVRMLLQVLFRLREAGNTILVVEHNLDVIKCADWIIDLGPDGGYAGGEVVVAGPPGEVARHPVSRTGAFLRSLP